MTDPWLPMATVKILYTADDPESLPKLPFSAFRGALGAALRKISCVLKSRKSCLGCPLSNTCAYGYLFETPRPQNAEKLRGYPFIPHPFVFNIPYPLRGSAEFPVELTLVGRAIDFTPHIILALQLLGEKGLGKRRCKLTVKTITDGTTKKPLIQNGSIKTPSTIPEPILPENPNTAEINFSSPTAMRYNRKYVSESQLEFHIIIRNLLRRASSLSYFHAHRELNMDYKSLISRAEKVQTTEKQLKTISIKRFSSRKKMQYHMKGFIGKATFAGDISPFAKLLILGSYIHIGKFTSFGFGQYRVNFR